MPTQHQVGLALDPQDRQHLDLAIDGGRVDAGYALTLVDILERAIDAIWRAHGDRMANLADLRAPVHPRRNTEYVDDGDPNAPTDTDF